MRIKELAATLKDGGVVLISPTEQIWKLRPREVNQSAKVTQLVSCGFQAIVQALDLCA